MFWFDNNLRQYCRRPNSYVSSNTRNVRSWNILPSIQILFGDSFPWLNFLSIMKSSIMILRTNFLRSNDPIWHLCYRKKPALSKVKALPYSFLKLIFRFHFKKSWHWIALGLHQFRNFFLNFALRDIHYQKLSNKIKSLRALFLPVCNCRWARIEVTDQIGKAILQLLHKTKGKHELALCDRYVFFQFLARLHDSW